MITKQTVFASAGKIDTDKTQAEYAAGMIPQTVAMAEDVNTYGFWSDRDLKVVCDEIVNALRANGITPNNSYSSGQSNQVATMLATKLQSGFALTGIDYETYIANPTTATDPADARVPAMSSDGNYIYFPGFDIIFNTAVYYGNTKSQQIRVTVPKTSVQCPPEATTGIYYIVADDEGALSVEDALPLGEDGAQKCLMGSVFVINGQFQPGSWKFQPWLQTTTQAERESPAPGHKGGFISPTTGNAVQMGAVELIGEGINFDVNPLKPSIVQFPAKDTFDFKLMYPGYDPSQAAYTDLTYAATHLYDIENGEMVDISTLSGFICLVPAITPTGQTLMIPAMGTPSGTSYTGIFEDAEQAKNAVYSLQYSLGRTAERCVYLGQTLIVRIGITDTLDSNNFITVGQLPQALAGFTEASGQTGGGTGSFVPMPVIEWPLNNDTIKIRSSAVNVIVPNTEAARTIQMPPIDEKNMCQFEIHYTHAEGAQPLNFEVTVKWWGSSPTWVAGTTYNIIGEYVRGAWRLGYLSMAN